MPEPFVTHRRVEFSDTDMAGIVHFSAFFRYLETAEHALLRSVGLRVHSQMGDELLSFPRVSARCDYRAPARFDDQLRIEVAVRRIGTKSVTYGFQVFRDETLLVDGEMTSVCCRWTEKAQPESVAIPADVVSKLSTYQVD